MDATGIIPWWGFSPAIDFCQEYKGEIFICERKLVR